MTDSKTRIALIRKLKEIVLTSGAMNIDCEFHMNINEIPTIKYTIEEVVVPLIEEETNDESDTV